MNKSSGENYVSETAQIRLQEMRQTQPGNLADGGGSIFCWKYSTITDHVKPFPYVLSTDYRCRHVQLVIIKARTQVCLKIL